MTPMFRNLSKKYIIGHIVILTLVWWILTKDQYLSWILGIPAIIVSLIVKNYAQSGLNWSLNILQIPTFTIFFIRLSIMGGLDVIYRAIHPQRPLNPDFMDYPVSIKKTAAQVFFANAISLLPGTFTVDLKPQSFEIHVLDKNLANAEAIRSLEIKVARLFNENLA